MDESDLMDELDALELELGDESLTEGADAEPDYLKEPDLPEAPTGAAEDFGVPQETEEQASEPILAGNQT